MLLVFAYIYHKTLQFVVKNHLPVATDSIFSRLSHKFPYFSIPSLCHQCTSYSEVHIYPWFHQHLQFFFSFKGGFSSKSSFFTLAVLIFKMKFPILSFVIGKNYWVMTGTKWNIISFQLHFWLKILNSPIFKSPPFLLYSSPVRTPSSPIQINPWNTYLETLAPFPHLPLFNPEQYVFYTTTFLT